MIHKQSTTSPYTIGNNKHEILISLLCHLRATPTCESTIKAFKNNKQLPHAYVRAKTTLLYYCSIFFSHVLTQIVLIFSYANIIKGQSVKDLFRV